MKFNKIVTDYLPLSKLGKDIVFTQNEETPWRLVDSDEGLAYEQLKKPLSERLKGTVSNVGVIASKSNYRLIFDALKTYDEVTFLEPGHRLDNLIDYSPNKDDIFKKYNKFMMRGYLSFLLSPELSELGFKRVEQFYILMLAKYIESKKIIYDGLIFDEESDIYNLEIKNISVVGKKEFIVGKYVDIINFVQSYAAIYSIPFSNVMSDIMSLYYNGESSDPFGDSGFIIFSKEESFVEISSEIYDYYYDHYLLIANTKTLYLESKISMNNQSSLIKTVGSSEISLEIQEYLGIQKNRYFIGKIIPIQEEYRKHSFHILKEAIEVLPLKDAILTLKLLVDSHLFTVTEDNPDKLDLSKFNLNISDNKEWVKKDYWDKIYASSDYSFEYLEEIILPEINSGEKCPICNKVDSLEVTPLKVYCKSKSCNFRFIRMTLKDYGVHRVRIEDIHIGMKYGSALVKTDSSKFIQVFVNKSDDGQYSFWWQRDIDNPKK